MHKSFQNICFQNTLFFFLKIEKQWQKDVRAGAIFYSSGVAVSPPLDRTEGKAVFSRQSPRRHRGGNQATGSPPTS